MNEKNIYIIGVGQLGYRHAESFLNYNRSEIVNIVLVDKSKNRVEQVTNELNKRNKLNNIRFLADTNLPMNKDIFLAILSTNSDVRFYLTKKLMVSNNIKNIILEKIIFQNPNEYKEINDFFKKHQIQAWVNTPMRIYPFYKKLKSVLEGNIKIKVTGTGWGLACNSIHFLDLMKFLSDKNMDDLVFSKNMDIVNSKREGYIELFGGIKVSYNKKNELYLSCNSGNFDRFITISADNIEVKIDEKNNKAKVNWLNSIKSEEWELNFPYQSQLTKDIFISILNEETDHLSEYTDVYKMHSKYVEEFCALKNMKKGTNSTNVNIT